MYCPGFVVGQPPMPSVGKTVMQLTFQSGPHMEDLTWEHLADQHQEYDLVIQTHIQSESRYAEFVKPGTQRLCGPTRYTR